MAEAGGGGEHGQPSAIHAAYEQLAKYGPVGGGQISLAAIARTIGMSRTQVYRHWPTAADLAADIAVIRSTPASGWHEAVCIDDGGPLEDALRRSLSSASSADGVLPLASLAVSPWSSAHPRVAAWERAHMVRLSSRLRREWGRDGDGPWTDIAIALIALVDGMHLMGAQFAEEPGALMPADLVEEVIETALRIVDFLLHEVEGIDAPIRSDDGLDAPDDRGLAPAAQRVADALAAGAIDPPSDASRRVIDMGVLARSRGVTERSLYTRWPEAADLNAELYLESVQRTVDSFGRIIMEVFLSNTSGTYTNTMPLIARMNEWFMTPDRFPEACVHLGLVDVLGRQDVLDRVRGAVEVGLQQANLQTAGIIHATGFRLRPDLRIGSHTMMIIGMGMGSHRTSALHPELLDRRLTYLGQEYLASGVSHTAMTRSSSLLLDPEVAGDASAPEPPVPESLKPVPRPPDDGAS